ncbi:MAG: signal recognition particle-docking protein FtsY [Candidatus Neomarinimicrobiota bacterium]
MVGSPFVKLLESLTRSRKSILEILGRIDLKGLSRQTMEELEPLLLSSDMGVKTTQEILEWMRERGNKSGLREDLRNHLESILVKQNASDDLENSVPTAVLVVGVNGTGKTTTVAKLAHRLRRKGRNVLLIAADTYRAAAVEQLKGWSAIAGVDLIWNDASRDPSSVIFDGMKAAESRGREIAIIDTAGRLHTSGNLMREVEKMYRVVSTKFPRFRLVNYITLDANLGQNSLSQASVFNEHIPLSGIILTKMDGTAKGGIIFRISRELNIPVTFLGVGETLDDLIRFVPSEYVSSLLGQEA